MTAEVVLMNREAIAMAADSAVTINEGDKIYNSANKVFMLAPGHSVGVLIYNSANFMMVPWEVIIKLYRDHVLNGTVEFKTLRDYGDNFFAFLRNKVDILCPAKNQKQIFAITIRDFLSYIVDEIDLRIRETFLTKARKVTYKEIEQIVGSVINQIYFDFTSREDYFSKNELPDFSKEISDTYQQIIDKSITEIFEKRLQSEEYINKVKELCILLFTKGDDLPTYTGVVIAGYGPDNLFPECISYHIDTVVCNHIPSVPEWMQQLRPKV